MSERDTAGVIAPPPLIYAVPLAVGLVVRLQFPLRFLPESIALLSGGALVLIAIVILVSADRAMYRAHTSPRPWLPTTALVAEGPFRFTRNPMYLGMTLFYIGIAILAQALWAFVLLPFVLILVQRGVIEREERYLERKFSADYLRYKQRVRRWL